MKKNRARVEAVHPVLEGNRLKVRLTVTAETGEVQEAYLPDRELSALLPRSILVGDAREAPPQLLQTIEPIVSKMAQGRQVRVWSYRERLYASFLPWRAVRFAGQ